MNEVFIKKLLIVLLALGSLSAFAKCSDYYDIAFDKANSFGFNLAGKTDEWAERADDEGKPALKVKAITVALLAMPYLLIEGGVTDVRRTALLKATNIIDYANGKISYNPSWRDFASSIVTGISTRQARSREDDIIAEVVSRLDRDEKICSIRELDDGFLTPYIVWTLS